MIKAIAVTPEQYEQDIRPPPLKFLTYAEMIALPEPQWLVEGVIQKQTAALIFGKSNTFKSFLAIDLGLSVDTGRAWHGNTVERGRVVFVATEGAIGVAKKRVPAWYDHHGIPEHERTAFLYPKEIRLDVADEMKALTETMAYHGPFALVVLDIFGGTMAGSEVEDTTARKWVHGIQTLLRNTGTAVLTVAHTGYQDDTRIRGHSHFWGSFDSRHRVEGDKDALTATMTVERHKDADSSGAWGFRLVPSCGSLIPEADAGVNATTGRKMTVRQRIALDALDDAINLKGTRRHGPEWPSNCPVVSIEHWKTECDRHALSSSDKPDSKLKAFNRVRDGLIDRVAIRIYDGFVWRCFDDK